MSTAENTSKASLPSNDTEHQPLVITVPKEDKQTVSVQNSHSDLSQNTIFFTEALNFLHGSNASPIGKLEIQVASTSAPSTVETDLKTPQKIF